MALPGNVTTVLVTATYLDAFGVPPRGTVTFTLDDLLVNVAEEQYVVPSSYTVPIDSAGAISVALPASDDPDVSPNGWAYTVTENYPGGRTYDITLTEAMAPTVDLVSLAPVATV